MPSDHGPLLLWGIFSESHPLRKHRFFSQSNIGVAHPVSILVDTYGTGAVSDEKLSELVGRFFDFRPAKIIEKLDLRRPIYEQVAAYGHFGRTDLDLSWERTDMVDALKAAL